MSSDPRDLISALSTYIHPVSTCFEHSDFHIGVLGQSGGYTEAGGTASNDYIVEVLRTEFLNAAES